eukprot:12571324-Alexandrium_andersonii.AAC.1
MPFPAQRGKGGQSGARRCGAGRPRRGWGARQGRSGTFCDCSSRIKAAGKQRGARRRKTLGQRARGA